MRCVCIFLTPASLNTSLVQWVPEYSGFVLHLWSTHIYCMHHFLLIQSSWQDAIHEMDQCDGLRNTHMFQVSCDNCVTAGPVLMLEPIIPITVTECGSRGTTPISYCKELRDSGTQLISIFSSILLMEVSPEHPLDYHNHLVNSVALYYMFSLLCLLL